MRISCQHNSDAVRPDRDLCARRRPETARVSATA